MAPSVWEIKIQHMRLGKYRTIRDEDKNLAREKAAAQLRAWDEQWERIKETEKKRLAREIAAKSKEQKTALALQQTRAAEATLEQIENTLTSALQISHRIQWDSLKSKGKSRKEKPKKPRAISLPKRPSPSDPRYSPMLGLLGHLFRSKREEAEEEAKVQFEQALREWQSQTANVQRQNEERTKEYMEELTEWGKLNKEHKLNQDRTSAKVEGKKVAYLACEPAAVTEYCGMVLNRSKYPQEFPKKHNLEYHVDTKLLVVDYYMPPKHQLPVKKAVRYIASQDEFKEANISESSLNKMYDSLLHQITIRTIYELFDSDVAAAIDSIVLNGWVEFRDNATGKEIIACILSIQTSKDEFRQLDLAYIDPRACFRQLKGVGSSRLSGLSPIAPILRIDKKDERFVSHYDVAESLDDSVNIAAMDWQDFENLIREIFEKEFSHGGGEVRVTRASRDGGVDAIAFDPDPIRGGKIVIQAKRYTNTVGLSAIRDLYGTVVNEGATKGILVTTSVYGPDAYEFAKDKPLSLLNGSNLLHLLEKHGQRARIDIVEAKTLLADSRL